MTRTPLGVRAQGFGWRHAGRSQWAFRSVDFAIEPGERVLLLGPSGAGKSTMLSAIANVLGGSDEGDVEGDLYVGDVAVRDAPRGQVGLMLQDPDAQTVMAQVGDDVAFSLENLAMPREQIWPVVREKLRDVGLDVPLEHPTNTLSGGQKQRLALAGVLAMAPAVLLLDEPTANLDPEGTASVRETVERVVSDRSMTTIIVEHRVELWIDFVDRVIVLEPAGGVLASGSPSAVLGSEGEHLAAAGVWVPGLPPRPTQRRTTPGTTSVLQTSSLAIGYGDTSVIRTIDDLRISEGRSHCITGVNGAGKSTLALTLAGLLRPAHGSVTASDALRARLASAEPIAWRSRDLLTRIGTVFQTPELQFVASTVREELAIAPKALKLDPTTIARRVDELLQRLRLESLAGANPHTLSGGEKRRLSVATVLATQPSILVLDEPTFGQDRSTWTELVSFLSGLLDEGHTLISVTHDDAYLEVLSETRIELLANGATRVAEALPAQARPGADVQGAQVATEAGAADD